MILLAAITNIQLQASLLHYIPVLLFAFAVLMIVISLRTQGTARFAGYGVALVCLAGMYILMF